MNFTADESVAGAIVTALREAGHEVYFITEQASSIDDASVLAIAERRKEVLLTEDKDFGELVFKNGHPHAGVVLMRLEGSSRKERSARLLMVVSIYSERLAGSFTVVHPGTVRVRPGR